MKASTTTQNYIAIGDRSVLAFPYILFSILLVNRAFIKNEVVNTWGTLLLLLVSIWLIYYYRSYFLAKGKENARAYVGLSIMVFGNGVWDNSTGVTYALGVIVSIIGFILMVKGVYFHLSIHK